MKADQWMPGYEERIRVVRKGNSTKGYEETLGNIFVVTASRVCTYVKI